MPRILVPVIIAVLALTGCAGEAPAAAAGESLAASLTAWDEAVAADDADALHRAALALPWDVVRDCAPRVDREVAAELDAVSKAALAELQAAAGDAWDAATDEIIAAMAPYLELVREHCA